MSGSPCRYAPAVLPGQPFGASWPYSVQRSEVKKVRLLVEQLPEGLDTRTAGPVLHLLHDLITVMGVAPLE